MALLGFIRSECEKRPAIYVLAASSALGLLIFICFVPVYYNNDGPRIKIADVNFLLRWRTLPISSMTFGGTHESHYPKENNEEIVDIRILNGTVFQSGSPNVDSAITNGIGTPSNERESARLPENGTASVQLQPAIGTRKVAVNACDIYSGYWVFDDSYPLYEAGKCPYVSGDFECKGNGRPDSKYESWRWQPRNCDIPRFNAGKMLEKLRGKRLVFVGDSLNRNQWESMICLLREKVPDDRKSVSYEGFLTVFTAQDYNFSVEFFWAPFLVERDETKDILRLDAIESYGSYWKDADILVFNTGHWWTHGNKVKARDFFQEGKQLYSELDSMAAFHKALRTWAAWIDSNIDPRRTQVYFRGYSPTHFSAEQWKRKEGHKCYDESEPILNDSFINEYPLRMQVVDEVLRQMRFPVSLMNITQMSDFRKDAHPSVYCLRKKKPLTAEQRNDPDQFADCSHWCLPGLPDIWNELLYASLVSKA